METTEKEKAMGAEFARVTDGDQSIFMASDMVRVITSEALSSICKDQSEQVKESVAKIVAESGFSTFEFFIRRPAQVEADRFGIDSEKVVCCLRMGPRTILRIVISKDLGRAMVGEQQENGPGFGDGEE